MKVMILAGGLGTRLGEETHAIPKPMVLIGGIPILWHVMNLYSNAGFNEFVILLGYKGYQIKEYFKNYFWHRNDVTIDLSTNESTFHNQNAEDWRVTLLDTGADTLTGGRVLRARDYVEDEKFMLTYGDGVSNVDIQGLLKFHNVNKKIATMTAVQPDGRFGTFEDDDGLVTKFMEKPKGDGSWINGGFFVFEKEVFDYIEDGDASILEQGPLSKLAESEQLKVFRHGGFWKCMDTLKDKGELENMWNSGDVPWLRK